MRKRATVLNDEPAVFNYTANGDMMIYKGNCLVDIKRGLGVDAAKKFKESYKDFKYIFIAMTKEEHDKFILLYENIVLTKQETVQAFTDTYGISPKNVVVYGDTIVSSSILKTIIPHIKIVSRVRAYSLADVERNRLAGQYIYSFKRFNSRSKSLVNENEVVNILNMEYDYKISHMNPRTHGLIMHEDAESSWNGLMLSMSKPSYGFIIKYFNDYIYCPEFSIELNKVE